MIEDTRTMLADADPCIYAESCAQYSPMKDPCNLWSGPSCKLWRLKKAEGKKE